MSLSVCETINRQIITSPADSAWHVNLRELNIFHGIFSLRGHQVGTRTMCNAMMNVKRIVGFKIHTTCRNRSDEVYHSDDSNKSVPLRTLADMSTGGSTSRSSNCDVH